MYLFLTKPKALHFIQKHLLILFTLLKQAEAAEEILMQVFKPALVGTGDYFSNTLVFSQWTHTGTASKGQACSNRGASYQ